MSDDQDDCMSRIKPLFRILHDALHEGMGFYHENYNDKARAQQRDRTAAGCVFDHAFHRLKETTDGVVPGCHFPNIRNLEVLNYQDRAVIRLKKVNGAGRSRNYRTPQQQNYDDQKPLPGLPEEAVRLIAGYQPDAAFSAVERVIISKPLGKTILWAAQIVIVDETVSWIDITPSRLSDTDRTDFDSKRRRSR